MTLAATKPTAQPAIAKKSKSQTPTASITLPSAKALQSVLGPIRLANDPTRLSILLMLAQSEMHVGAMCERLGQSQPAVSHHLALMRVGGLVETRRAGKNNFYSLSPLGREMVKFVSGMMSKGI